MTHFCSPTCSIWAKGLHDPAPPGILYSTPPYKHVYFETFGETCPNPTCVLH